MRVLVLGAGALGGFFGGKLQKGGADVTYLVRPRRAAQLAERGLVLRAQDGEIRLPAKVALAGQLGGSYDLILLCCKAYDLAGAVDAIAPAIGPGTAVLPFLNGVRHVDVLTERFGAAHVLGGATAVNAVLEPGGDVVQTPVRIAIPTAFGELDGRRSPRAERVLEAFTRAGVAFAVRDDILAFMWQKFYGFASIATTAILTRSRAGAIARSRTGAALVSAILAEVAGVVTAEGFAAPAQIADVVRGIYAQADSKYGPSILVDVEEGRPTEAAHTIGDLVERAGRRGLAVPLLTAALGALEAYEVARSSRAAR